MRKKVHNPLEKMVVTIKNISCDSAQTSRRKVHDSIFKFTGNNCVLIIKYFGCIIFLFIKHAENLAEIMSLKSIRKTIHICRIRKIMNFIHIGSLYVPYKKNIYFKRSEYLFYNFKPIHFNENRAKKRRMDCIIVEE